MAILSSVNLRTNETDANLLTTLRGSPLWIVRAFWLILCGGAVTIYAPLLALILRSSDYGDWTIEESAKLFGIDRISAAFDTYALFLIGLKYAALAVFIGMALYIFWRKSEDWMAILVSLTLLTLPHLIHLGGYTEDWYLYHSPWDKILYALNTFFNGAGYVLLFWVLFLFPDGRFVPRWTRWFALVPPVLIGVVWTSEILHIQIAGDDSITWLVLVVVLLALFLLGAWSQIHRYRFAATPAQKSQTRIVVLCLASLAIGMIVVFGVGIVGVGFVPPEAGALVSFLFSVSLPTLLPLGLGVAMLRDQLWASERVLNRAFVFGALTAILLVVYVLIVGGSSELFRGTVTGSTNNFLPAVIATGVVALLFQPLRERLQRSLNRFLYGERDEPFRVLNQLGAQLENTLTPDAALPLIVETIARTMRVAYAGIELTAGGGPTIAAQFGKVGKDVVRMPLRYQTETVGELIVARRGPNENFTRADSQLLENLARQAGAVAYTARLNAQLQHSRERIISEREQERKRLRRDLHDGLGPTLASQTLKLDAALELLHGQDAANASARRILQDVKTQTQNTVADIRRIVYALRPPALDDLGLLGALRAQLAQSNGVGNLQIIFDAPAELPPLSAAVQVNAYRIVLEAVNNVVRHAQAQNCRVSVAANGHLRLEIADDGIGVPETFGAGVGLRSMRERAEELGGTFHLVQNTPHGTRIVATLPISNLLSPLADTQAL